MSIKHKHKLSRQKGKRQVTVYLAGPMRHKPYLNFLQFDTYKAWLVSKGIKVISPADIDRKHEFDPFVSMTKNFPKAEDCAKRDIKAIIESDAIVLLPGTINKSTGGMMEIAAAIFLGRPVYQLKKPTP